MTNSYQDKQMKPEEKITAEVSVSETVSETSVSAKPAPMVTPHFFPKYSITIHASSKREALEKLEEHIKNLANNK